MLPIPSFSQSQTAADGRMQFNNNARRAGFNPKDALRWQMSQPPQPQPMPEPMGVGMMSAGGPFAAAQRGLDRITAPHNFDTGPMSHPRGPAPVIGMTPRGMNAIGGATLEPNLAQNPGMSFGGTHDDGYRIGAGSGDGKFHDTFGTGIADIKKHGPGAGMGRGVAQQMSAPGMMGPPNPNDPYDPLWKQGYADGGMVTGPGGPKDDMVPAMIDGMKPAKLSSGEFVMPAEAVQFFGLDRLNKMKEKAKEGLMQMHAGEDADEHTEPHGMADMREDRAEGENDDPAGYAAGGFVNRFADDPMAAALREQEAKDARLAAIGGADLGGGNVAFRNRYGAGFATNPNGPMATPGGGVFNNSGDAMRVNPQGGLMPVPDVIPPGPWSNGARPFDSAADRANIDFTTKAMERDAPFMRQTDIALKAQRLATEPKGRGFITVPDATTKFPGSTGTLNDGHFLAPWEKDKIAADARAASDPLATLIPRATDRRRFMRTPQGIETARRMQEDQQSWTPIPGTDYIGNGRQVIPTRRAQASAITPEQAAALGMKPATLDSRGNVTYRPEAAAKEQPEGVHATKEIDGVLYNMTKTGEFKRAPIKDPTPDQKARIFKQFRGKNPVTKEDWQDAHYLATQEERNGSPSAAGTQAAAPPAAHIAYLKAHPEAAAQFEAKYPGHKAASFLK